MTDLNAPRIAAIDIGTNSVLLTVARPRGTDLELIEQFATVTRLGQDVDRTGQLHPDAIERTLACLRTYRGHLDRHHVARAHAVGTSALRDAAGGPEFVERAHEVLGFRPEIISGVREAELTFRGALHGLPLEGKCFVFDIGGGSTELIVGTKVGDTIEIDRGISLDMGSVRLTERFSLDDPPTEGQLANVRSEVHRMITESGFEVPSDVQIVGVAGTVTTLAAISERMDPYDPAVIHGFRLQKEAISSLTEKLGRMTIEERKALPGLTPGRADVIAAGALLCDELVGFAQGRELVVSDRGVRFGLLAELSS